MELQLLLCLNDFSKLPRNEYIQRAKQCLTFAFRMLVLCGNNKQVLFIEKYNI